MCMTFACKHQINFCHFFRSSNFVLLGLKQLNTGYPVNASSTVLARSRSEDVHVIWM